MTIQEQLDLTSTMAQRIAGRFKPQRIVLFGSLASGTATPDSDADLLVIMPFSGRRRDAVLAMLRECASIAMAKDVFVVSPEEYERWKDSPGSIAWPAEHGGKVLYAA